jgi:hypothetical protein
MKASEIIDKGDSLLQSVSGLDKSLYKTLTTFLSKNVVGGRIRIKPEDLAILEELIYADIKDSDYEETMSKYLGLVTALENSISQEQANKNDLKVAQVKELWRGNELRNRLVDKIVYDLGAGGIKEYFVKGLSQIVREADYYNLTIEDAVGRLQKVLLDDGYTQKYIKSVAMDSLAQFDGAINDTVRDAYGFDTLLYITNTIETSRPFCIHVHDELGGKITGEQLKQALNEYCPDGIPSEQKVSYKTHSGEIKTGKKGSGMIQGTRYENFSQLRGGYGCRHRAIWVRK